MSHRTRLGAVAIIAGALLLVLVAGSAWGALFGSRTDDAQDEEANGGGRGKASRLVIPALDVDLAVVSGDLALPGSEPGFPLCGVAQFLPEYSQPGRKGTTYLYAHAREGMLLPLLEASQVDDGQSLIGQRVLVFTTDGQRYIYRIDRVKRHATDFSITEAGAPGEQRLVVQTSEGTTASDPKLQVAASLVRVASARAEEANPSPQPIAC